MLKLPTNLEPASIGCVLAQYAHSTGGVLETST